MKEFDENIQNDNDDSSDTLNCDMDLSKGEKKNDSSENNCFCEESGKENREESEIQEKNNENEKVTDVSKKNNTDAKEKTDNEEDQINSSFPKYSSSYAPPHYLPNFSNNVGKFPEKEKKKNNKGLILALVAICIVTSFIIGGIAGAFGASLMFAESGLSDNKSKEEINVTKNDGSITVNEVVGSTGESNLTIAEVAAKVSGCVVEVALIDSGAAGSGVIFSQTDEFGYIVTNYHVVDGGNKIAIRLIDGTEYEATYIDGDEMSDIAVLKISKYKSEEFNTAVLGSSQKLQVGEGIVAIGNPLGTLGGTVTDGIISALDRQILVDNIPMVLLQHNAAINSGNSGGGLFNMAGELVGIVNAKKAAEGIEGLGFAIPIDLVSNSITEILENGYISGRPTIGIDVEYGTPYFWSPYGVYVTTTANENFKIYDRLVSIDGQTITGILDYYAALDSSKIGKVIEVVVYRNNLQVKLEVEVIEYRPDLFE